MIAESESVAAWKSGSLLIELQFDWSSRFWRNKVSESTFIFPLFEFCWKVVDAITSFVSEWAPLVLQNSNFSKKFGSMVDPFFWSRCLITFCCFNMTYNGSEHQYILPIHARSIKITPYNIYRLLTWSLWLNVSASVFCLAVNDASNNINWEAISSSCFLWSDLTLFISAVCIKQIITIS